MLEGGRRMFWGYSTVGGVPGGRPGADLQHHINPGMVGINM